MELGVHSRIAELSEADWDQLVDPLSEPFTRWAWLEALESGASATADAGWQPCHLSGRRTGVGRKRLTCVAPAYLHDSSDGDFSRDWGWAAAAERAGIAYYPKLVLTVPFTPVTGRRFLVAGDEDQRAALAFLAEGALALARKHGFATVQVLFPTSSETALLAELGWSTRVDFQFHWRNDGYGTPEDFLARFSSKKRHQQRRERAAPARQGLTLRTVRGEALAAERARWGKLAFELHRSTVDKLMWGRRWLGPGFYDRVFERMPESLELVIAERDGEIVAGAFNVATPTRLLGRYWGCFEEHPFLHFNVCLYHSIDDCIARGLLAFEGGAGGEHKIARGFLPTETWSAHYFLDRRLEASLRPHLAAESAQRQAALLRFRAESPILKPLPEGLR